MSDVFAPEDQPLIERIGQTLEGKTERQKNPHPSGSLAHATWVCARLGGWNGYGRKPGPIVLARGHVRLRTMIEGIKRLNPVGRVPAIYAVPPKRGWTGHARPWRAGNGRLPHRVNNASVIPDTCG